MNARAVIYSAEELAFIEARKTLTRAALHAAFIARFGRTDVRVDRLRALCVRKGWTVRESWTPESDAALRASYPHMSTAKVAALVGRALLATYRRASALGLKKSAVYLASPDACRLRTGITTGATHRFKKGHTPMNKGVEYPNGWAPGRMKETQFKPGQHVWNWKPIGSVRVIDGYQYTKISDIRRVSHTVNWKLTHVLHWEAVHGPLPKGHALKCLDSNPLNVDPANWQLIPRSLLLQLNGARGRRMGYDEAPDDLKPTIMAIATVEHAVFACKRKAARA